jgi:hypothetical protein
MKNFLKKLYILQEVSNEGRDNKFGKGFAKAYKFNPFNPLSYVAILLFLIFGILMFGFMGISDEMDLSNPFKWN